MKLTLPILPETNYNEDYNLYLSQKEVEFWQSVGILPCDIKEGDMVLGGRLVITKPIVINEA